MGSAHVAGRFWSADSVVVVNGRHVESSWTRDWTCVPCIGRKILNHWTIREVLRSVWLVSSGYFLKVSCFDRQTLTWFFGGGGGLVAQSCPTLCDRMDRIPPGSSVHGISQARILEWVAISQLLAPCALSIEWMNKKKTWTHHHIIPWIPGFPVGLLLSRLSASSVCFIDDRQGFSWWLKEAIGERMCTSSSWKQKFTLSSYIPKAQLTGFTDGLVWGVRERAEWMRTLS